MDDVIGAQTPGCQLASIFLCCRAGMSNFDGEHGAKVLLPPDEHQHSCSPNNWTMDSHHRWTLHLLLLLDALSTNLTCTHSLDFSRLDIWAADWGY